MKWFKWYKGRQPVEEKFYYEKMKIFQIYKMDCYLIRYTRGCAVGYHKDEVSGHKHYRLNIQITGKNRLCILRDFNRKMGKITFFRADEEHSFGITMEKGLILSFGIAIKRNI